MKNVLSIQKLSLLLIIITVLTASCSKKIQTFSLAFYNVENLFDTIDDKHKQDNKYLPDSKIPWNTERYNHKMNNLTQVFNAIDSVELPSVIGLAEVENMTVLKDLVAHPAISETGYKILHQESEDERGIDVALLYRPDKYAPLETNYIQLIFPFNPTNGTRDILYSKGLAGDKDTVHIFINHWTSRWGGQEKTEPSRRYTAEVLKSYTDSILYLQPNANIIIAGDLNDNPDDISIVKDLMAIEPTEPYMDRRLYNLSIKQYKMGEGTLYYRGWDMFDQIIVSTALLKGQSGMLVTSRDQQIIKKDWMLFFPKRGEPRPNRTATSEYFGGYSDHLPVYLKINLVR
ncbi:MAG: endonuclease/exonuclease/phosphatase family protein [Bacteroidetes bacterium]|nr:endonuclease/exonuclease/phosphatase family protein [Bacteroidota bacterium]